MSLAAFEFEPTAAVSAARAHKRFVRCPACQSDNRQLPVPSDGRALRPLRGVRDGLREPRRATRRGSTASTSRSARPFENDGDRALMLRDFARSARARRDRPPAHQRQSPSERSLSLGRFLRDFRDLAEAKRVGLEVAEIDDAAFAQTSRSVRHSLGASRCSRASPQVVILHELLESCGDPGAVLGKLVAALPPSTLFVVTYTNTRLAARAHDAPPLAAVLRAQDLLLQHRATSPR